MTSSEVLALLTRLVVDGRITEEEAAEVFSQWQDGLIDIPDIPDIRRRDDDTLALLAAALVLGLTGGGSGKLPVLFSTRQTSAFPNLLQDWWVERSNDLGAQFASGAIGVDELFTAANADLQAYMAAQHMGGFRGLRSDVLGRSLLEQRAYLSRFRDEVAYRVAIGDMPSGEYIANRLSLYGGAGRGEFWLGDVTLAGEASRERPILVHYRAVDDGGTCSACHSAQGVYYVNDPALPLPGRICYGGSKCRCWIEYIYE